MYSELKYCIFLSLVITMNTSIVYIRVVTTAMKCFHEIKGDISRRCSLSGADEYHQSFIQPLVERTRSTVLTKCRLLSPYQEYFVVNTSASGTSWLRLISSSRARSLCAFVTLLFVLLRNMHLVITTKHSRYLLVFIV